MSSPSEAMLYREAYGTRGELQLKTPHHFHVTVSPSQRLWGNPLGLAENVVCSADQLFYGRTGGDLGLKVHNIEEAGAAAVTWRDVKTGETRLLMMTDGNNIVAPDPCFLPIGDPGCSDNGGIDIGIRSHNTLASYQHQMPWVEAVAVRLGINNGHSPQPLSVEEMAGHMKRRLHEAQIKNRRSHF